MLETGFEVARRSLLGSVEAKYLNFWWEISGSRQIPSLIRINWDQSGQSLYEELQKLQISRAN